MDKNQIIIMSAEDIDNLANIVAKMVFDKISTMQQTKNTASDKSNVFEINGGTLIHPAKEEVLPQISQDYLNTKETLRVINRSMRMLTKYIHEGKILPIRIRKYNFFYLPDVLKLNQELNNDISRRNSSNEG